VQIILVIFLEARNIVILICIRLDRRHTVGMNTLKDIYETTMTLIGLLIGILVILGIPTMCAFLLYIGCTILAYAMIGAIVIIILTEMRETQKGK